MSDLPRLIIGNKNYSTWSLRPWLLLHGFKVDFDEQLVSLNAKGLQERLRKFSKTARVPVLIDGATTIWDSLAICEYVNENYLDGRGWPRKTHDRALARSIVAEMHSGFSALRNELPMNIRASRIVEMSDDTKEDIRRVDEIFNQYVRADVNGNPHLFGEFGIADCFFAPVVMRFKTYAPELSIIAQGYCDALQAHSSFKKWIGDALLENEIIEQDEAGREV